MPREALCFAHAKGESFTCVNTGFVLSVGTLHYGENTVESRLSKTIGAEGVQTIDILDNQTFIKISYYRRYNTFEWHTRVQYYSTVDLYI